MEVEKMSPWVMVGITGGRKSVELEEIMDIVCRVFQSNKEMVMGKSRKRRFVVPRHVYCYLSKKYTDKILFAIGDLLDKDHSSVHHSINSIEGLITSDKRLRELVNKCEINIQCTIGQLVTI